MTTLGGMRGALGTSTAAHRATAARLDVRPSDLDQSIVRVLIVSAVLVWSCLSVDSGSLGDLLRYKHVAFAVAYLTFSFVVFGWTWIITRASGDFEPGPAIIVTRVVGIFADIGAISVYTATSGSNGIILLPVYLTSIIGYGYRFGVRYLYFTLGTSAVFFAIAAEFNQYILDNPILIGAYYLGIIVVPLYAASLLRKHREVLDRLHEVNAARSRFIANMSHELRTPLHAIISVSDVLREDLAARQHVRGASDANRDSVQKIALIADSAQYLLGLVNKILDVAAADAGKMLARRQERVNLIDVTQTALRICAPKADEKGIGFHWFHDARLPVWMQSSAEHIQEILINTVGNAVKYTESGYVQVRFTLGGSAARPLLEIGIVDTGIGIPAKILPNIFEPFTLGDDSAQRRFAGTGLGLTLTKQYVELLAGHIEFQSVEDIGTHCRIHLPLEAPPATDAAAQAEAVPRPCLLICATRPADDERNVFAAAGWDCRIEHNLQAAELIDDGTRVVFIDADLLAYQEAVTERLARLVPQRLLVLYGVRDPGAVTAPCLRSAVVRGDLGQLVAVRELEGAVFPAASAAVPAPSVEVVCRRVLVADDNHTNLKTARMALESVGHSVVCVSSGEDALAALDVGDFDLALVDMHMPGMSGIEVAQIYQFVNAPDPTPIAILTADVTAEAREAAADSGAVAYLTKPLRASELRDAVQRHARGGGAGTAIAPAPTAAPSADAAVVPTALIVTREIDELSTLGIHADELESMIREFAEEGHELIDQARAAIADDDLAVVRNHMHSLKGAAGTVGAQVLQARAYDIERGVWREDADTLAERLEALPALLDASAELLLARVRSGAAVDAVH